jgi:hypothetical protein
MAQVEGLWKLASVINWQMKEILRILLLAKLISWSVLILSHLPTVNR